MIHLVPPEDRKVTQRMSKALARDNRHVADVEGTSIPMRCWKCEGTLRAERAIDMQRGVSILLYACFNCGRHWHAGDKPRPVTAA